MAKKDNEALFIIILIILGGILINSQSPQEDTVGLTVHYYKDGVEVSPQKNLFSIVTPGGVYDQMSFDITAQNTGETPIENIQIVDAYPQAFKDSLLSATPQSLSIGETKTLWTSDLIDAKPLESYSQPINFWINVSGFDEFNKKIVYTEYVVSITIEPDDFIINELSAKQSEPLTFSGNQDIIRYLKVPKESIISSAVMNLRGDYIEVEKLDNTILPNSNFESISNWNYKEVDISGTMTNEGRNCEFRQEGSCSYILRHENYVANAGDYQEFNQALDLTNINTISIMIRQIKYFGTQGNGKHQILIDSDVKADFWQYYAPAWIETKIDVSGYSGIHTLRLRRYAHNTGVWAYRTAYDNIKLYPIKADPTNPSIRIDTSNIWAYSGEFSLSQQTNDFTSIINTYLSTCTADIEGDCDVPIIFHSDTAGILEYSNINISGRYV